MHPQIESLFDDAESRYLKLDELTVLNQYVDSLPQRLETYRHLRDQEIEIMQPVADQLQIELSNASTAELERSLKNALLVLRYCSMAMLLNDDRFLQNRLLNWVSETAKVYNSQTIDTALYRLLNQRLSQVLSPAQLALVKPHLSLAQTALLNPSTMAV
jgi:hypothetical protein